MTTALIIIGVIVGIIVVILIIASMQKDEITITREITIKRRVSDVYNYAKLLKNGDKYNKWVMADPNMKKNFRGVDGTVGFVYAWDSQNKQAGKGEEEITKLVENSFIEHEIRFEKPMQSVAKVIMDIKRQDENTTVFTWSFTNKLNLMMKVMHLFFNFEKLLGADMQHSLLNLKNNIEHNG
ncbi:MAG: SRPBCC family protein [Sphingobacteriales bacterium JAD_PAG50586_3]|nr:MAG: SRPBCC family protein [Sphingobacteriales bacterium JAD_PAG50586_3]